MVVSIQNRVRKDNCRGTFIHVPLKTNKKKEQKKTRQTDYYEMDTNNDALFLQRCKSRINSYYTNYFEW